MNITDFEQAKQETITLAQAAGQQIDTGIVDSVTALRLLGFNTVGSCEGHDDHITGGPFVMFESPESKDLMEKLTSVQDAESDEYKSLYAQISQANIGEVQKLLTLLDGFYAERDTPSSERLIIRCFGPSVPKLMCQNADLGEILDERERRNLLSDNQLEMMAFTNYLKETA